MRFEQLNCLVEIEKAGSITSAAQKLFVTQQAVSLNIKQLEKELGCPLLIRTKTGVQLTENGKKTVAFAKNVLQEKDNLLRELVAEEEKKEQTINEYKICSTSAVINYVLPTVLSYTEVQEQKIRLNITNTESVDYILQQLEEGTRDLGLISINENELKNINFSEKIAVEELYHDEVVVVFHKRLYERYGKEDIDLLEIINDKCPKTLYNIIPAKAYRDWWDDYVACSTDVGFHRSMLEKHEAIAFMPRLASDYFFSSKRYMSLPLKSDTDMRFPFVHLAIYLKENKKLRNFVKHIKKEMNVKQD